MTPDMMKRIEQLFVRVMDLPHDERFEFLDRYCPDTTIREEVRSLVAHATGEAGMLDAPPVAAPFGQTFGGAVPAGLGPVPESVGSYRVVRFLGAGGMGVVYLAEQSRPRRTVALKLVRGGVLSPTLVRRFEREAEILGRLQHPGIAQIYEAGIATVSGHEQPFLAMELVEGPPITDYVETRRFDPASTLELVARVCDAVQHAHQRGVIHRDLKPSNILIDPHGQPKILDFGVARLAQDDRDALTTMRTHAGQLVGTLAYMSPEQLSGNQDDVDVRSDVYALGVVLYQLLVGRLPHDLTSRSVPDAARTILHEPPTRMSSINRDLRGDVETIVGKAIEKDVARRYQSAADLSDDIRRYLDGKPILARQDSALYLLRKSLDRYRGLTRLAVASVLALSVLAVFAFMQAHRVDMLRQDLQVSLDETTRRAESLRQAHYATRIGFAQAALQAGDVARARSLLSECAPDLRRFEWNYLAARTDQSVRVRQVHPRVINFAAFSPSIAVTLHNAMPLEIFDSRSFDVVDFDTSDQVWPRFAINPFGEVLAVVEHGQVSLFDHHAGEVIWSVPQSIPDARVDVSADGFVVVLGMRDLAIHHRDDPTRPLLVSLPEASAAVRVSPDGRWVAAALYSGGLVLIDTSAVDAASAMIRYPTHRAGLRSIAFSADGTELAAGTIDGSLAVWPVSPEPPPRPRLLVPLHDNKITAVCFSPDGDRIATGSTDNRIRIIDAQAGYIVATRVGHAHTVIAVQFTGDESLVSASLDGSLRAWDLRPTPEESPLGLGFSLYGLALASDGRTVLVAGSGGGVARLTETAQRAVGQFQAGSGIVRHLVEGPRAGTVLMGTGDGGVVLADEVSGVLSRAVVQSGLIGEVACDASSGLVAAAGPDGLSALRLSGTALEPLEPILRGIDMASVAIHPEGSLIAAGSMDGRVWLIEPSTRASSLAPVSMLGPAWSLRFTPDGRTLIITTEDARVLLFDRATAQTRELLGHLGPVYDSALSPDGQRLATGSFDNTVRLWSLETGTELIALRGHRASVHALCFDRSGERIIAVGDDGRVCVWSASQEARLVP